MVAREIDLEKKQVCVPTPMIQELLFELPILVANSAGYCSVNIYC
jgi:hypothetical protein